MGSFQENASDLPTTDKDGNAITEQNPLTLEDILVRIMELTDVARGGPPTDPVQSPFNYANRALFLRDIFLDGKIDKALQAVGNISIAAASTAAAGIIEILTQTEARLGTDTTRALTVALLLDFLRNGTGVGASTTRKGTVELATKDEAETATATSLVLTAKTGMDQIRSENAEATETRRGTLEKATKTEAENATANNKAMTPLRAEEHFDSHVWIGTEAQFKALTSKPAGRLHFIT